MNSKRWTHIKSLRIVPRMLHKSCDAWMQGVPKADGTTELKPMIGPGTTYNIGSNKAKREARRRSMYAKVRRLAA